MSAAYAVALYFSPCVLLSGEDGGSSAASRRTSRERGAWLSEFSRPEQAGSFLHTGHGAESQSNRRFHKGYEFLFLVSGFLHICSFKVPHIPRFKFIQFLNFIFFKVQDVHLETFKIEKKS